MFGGLAFMISGNVAIVTDQSRWDATLRELWCRVRDVRVSISTSGSDTVELRPSYRGPPPGGAPKMRTPTQTFEARSSTNFAVVVTKRAMVASVGCTGWKINLGRPAQWG